MKFCLIHSFNNRLWIKPLYSILGNEMAKDNRPARKRRSKQTFSDRYRQNQYVTLKGKTHFWLRADREFSRRVMPGTLHPKGLKCKGDA